MEARFAFGQYSEASATAIGVAPPRTRPPRKRQNSNSVMHDLVVVASVHSENSSTQQTRIFFGPNLSASGPKRNAPAIVPTSAALNTGPSIERSILSTPVRIGAT